MSSEGECMWVVTVDARWKTTMEGKWGILLSFTFQNWTKSASFSIYTGISNNLLSDPHAQTVQNNMRDITLGATARPVVSRNSLLKLVLNICLIGLGMLQDVIREGTGVYGNCEVCLIMSKMRSFPQLNWYCTYVPLYNLTDSQQHIRIHIFSHILPHSHTFFLHICWIHLFSHNWQLVVVTSFCNFFLWSINFPPPRSSFIFTCNCPMNRTPPPTWQQDSLLATLFMWGIDYTAWMQTWKAPACDPKLLLYSTK